jgi:two-component system, OmpR family, sensor kinase
MRQPRSIRFHLALVFLFFFLLVVVLGAFSISRLNHFNRLSADIAGIWLPSTRVLGDLNNFTSDFRAIEGSNLLSADAAEIAATEKEMAELDRSIAEAERSFERIRHDAAEGDLYVQFKERWNDYRKTVNRMLALSRSNRKTEAIAIYMSSSRAAYNAASDTLGQLTDRVVADAHVARDRLASAYRQAFWLIGLAIAIAGVMVAGALLYIGRFISAPLLQLAERMHRLAANDTDIDIPGTDRRDEIGEMARAAVVFRSNAIELMRSQSVLARQAAMLEEQLAQEQRLALLQRNFVSMASHEFRTPLTIIDGHARRLIKMKDRITPDEISERAGKVRSAVLRLTHLIDNLLNSSRLIDGGAGLYFNPAEIDVTALLHEICQLHREMVPSSQIVERFGAGPLSMVGDQKLLFQAFSNLLSNAVKYSPGGGPIEVSAEAAPLPYPPLHSASISADTRVFDALRTRVDALMPGEGREGAVVVTIADHGIGIPASDLDRLFERYHRGSNVSGIVGTGVGLYLVKMMVDLHGGSIAVESKEGEGSRFTVRLPIRRVSQGELLSSSEPAFAVQGKPQSDPQRVESSSAEPA